MKRLSITVCIITIVIQCFVLCGCSKTSKEVTVDNEQNNSNIQKEYTELEIEYKILPDGTAEVSGFSGDGNHATIDLNYEGCKVVRIANSAFEGCTSLETVLFWANIEEIGDAAFKDCTALIDISIPAQTIAIGDYAFYGCNGLKKITIGGDPNIGDYAFANCSNLEKIDISYNTEYVGEYAFNGCLNLSDATIWNDSTVFGYEAFGNCPKLLNRPNEEYPRSDSCNENITNQSDIITEDISIISSEENQSAQTEI